MNPAGAPLDPTTAAPTGSPSAAQPVGEQWTPRLWHGFEFFGWLRLLVRNRFAVEPPYWHIALVTTVFSFAHLILRWMQYCWYGDRIAATQITDHPIFVIGHWRTGTTLLHELLILDDRWACPDTYACLEPNHTLLTEHVVKSYFGWAMPEQRPMDRMAAGWDRPQEDEFALCMLGLPSTYTDFAFPNRPPTSGALDLSGLSRPELQRWKRGFRRFLQMLTFRDQRRLVLKSPPHTARLPVLLEMFPDARFVHIVRDPYVVFPSTVHLWESLGRKHGLQAPRSATAIRDKVFREFRVIYDRLEESKGLVPPGRFFEVRYESLIKDPVGEMQRLYTELGLGGFEVYRPKLEAYLQKHTGYETNKYQLSDSDRDEITRQWGDVIRRYGYG